MINAKEIYHEAFFKGDIEEWRGLPQFPGYEFSSIGRVRSVDRTVITSSGRIINYKGRLRKACYPPKGRGYGSVSISISGKCRPYKIHKLIAWAFLGDDNGLQVNHIDGDKSNNNVSNLEYVTNKENQIHAYKNGLKASQRMEDNGNSKLDISQVLTIETLGLNKQWTDKRIAEVYNVSRSTVYRIRKKDGWLYETFD